MTDSTTTTAPVRDPRLREMAALLHARYTLAARIARATWPATETSPEAMVAATATVFIAMNGLLGHGHPAGDRAAAGHVGRVAATSEVPRSCPVCQGPMRDQRSSKRGNQPDFKCAARTCDGAVWLDRVRRADARAAG